MTSDEILRVEHLKKYFPVEKGFLERLLTTSRRFVKAVDDVSFSINKGEVFSLVGESGCGKSTTGRLVVRLIEPTSGQVFFDQQNITEIEKGAFREYRRKLQIIFQDPYASLNPRMKVGQAVGHPLEIHHLERATKKEKKSWKSCKELGSRRLNSSSISTHINLVGDNASELRWHGPSFLTQNLS